LPKLGNGSRPVRIEARIRTAKTSEIEVNQVKSKTHTLLAGLAALLLSASICGFPPSLHAQSQNQGGAPPPNPTQQQQMRAFAGKVMQLKSGNYALITGTGPQGQVEGHYIDDSKDAKKYVGHNVKVTGTLNMATNTIHVQKIRPQ
jgi:hypothetical protein